LMGRMGQLGSSRALDGLVGPAVGRAPAPLPEGARFEDRTYANEAGSRPYKLYVPSGYTGQALPLVVMLHGCTQSPDDFAAGTRMNELAEEEMFLVAYPAQTQTANMSKCWNWFSAGDQQRDQGEPSLIAGITRQILRDFPVESGRVYIAGLSAGGAAAAVMGANYPDLYAAIGVHSGLACGAASDMPSAFAAMRQGGSVGAGGPHHHGGSKGAVPTIVFHGDRDTTVNPVNGDQVIAQAKATADLRTTVSRGAASGGIGYTRTVQADESGRPMLEQWVLHGAGHAWSGGSPAGSYTEPRGPDASREMMRFFLEQSTTEASVS
jgi:poly(hydroxyalkanoate) depolymerase family esterase